MPYCAFSAINSIIDDVLGGIMTGFWLVSYIMLWLLVIVGGLILIALAREVETLHKQIETLGRYLTKTDGNP